MDTSTTAMWPLRKARNMVDIKVVTSIKIEPAQNEELGDVYHLVFLTRFDQEARLRTSHSKVSRNRERHFLSEEEAKLFVNENFNMED